MSDSIWKKEISFSRKPKPAASPAPEPPVETEPSVPWWRKEVSLSRAPKPPATEPLVETEPPVETEPSVPWWRKEISLSRAPKPVAPAPAAPAPDAPVFPPVSQPAPPRPALDPVSVPVPAAAAEPVTVQPEPLPAPEPPAEAAAAPSGDVQAEVVHAEVVEPDEPWLADPVLASAPDPEPVAVQPEPVAVEPEPAEVEPDPVAVAPGPELEPQPAAVEPDPVAVAPEPEPASLPEPPALPEPPVVVHPPVAAAEPAARTPFWKLSRRPKAPKRAKVGKSGDGMQAPVEQSPKPARPSPHLPTRRRGNTVVGLKIGASQLAAARISNDAGAELQQVARAPLARGIVVGGELRDPDALADALRGFFSANRLPRKGVRLGIATPRIGVRIFEVAGIGDERQFGNAVRFRAQEVLPIPLDEAVLDYRVLDESVDDDGQVSKRVLLVVAHRELVDRYVVACRAAGITLSGIDLEAFALLRSLAPPTERGGSALVAVSIGHERTTLAVSDGRVCEFTRVLEWGGWALNVALARALDSTPAEVESLKRRLSLEGRSAPEHLTPDQEEAALDALRRGVESLARELVSSLQFYQGQPGSLGIGEIVITGGSAHMAGIAEELQRLVGVRVRVGNPLNRIRVARQVAEPDVGSLAVAIGLGIED